MKKTLLLFCVSLLAFSLLSAKKVQITTFNDLMKALNNGEHVRVIIHYGKSMLEREEGVREPGPEAIGGMSIETYEYFAAGLIRKKASVVFSESSFIQSPFRDGYVYNYVRFRIFEDNSVQVTAQYIDVKTFEVKMNQNYYTEINNRKNNGGLFLFR